MTWRLFRWVWRLEAPLFVGTSPAGALNRCRLYVPARTVWGALAAELTRHAAGPDELSAQCYADVGRELKESCRFTYLFPAENTERGWRAWTPKYRAGDGLIWFREDDHEETCPRKDRVLRRRLLYTRAGTAIDPTADSAEEGSLHETECIQKHWRDEEGLDAGPVALLGYVFCRDNGDQIRNGRLWCFERIEALFAGGDVRYGLGRLELERASMVPATSVFGASAEVDQDEPRILTDRALAHAYPDRDVTLCGDQEAVGGWDMTGQQRDRRISGPVWVPGSRCRDEQARRWQLLESGMLRLAEAAEA